MSGNSVAACTRTRHLFQTLATPCESTDHLYFGPICCKFRASPEPLVLTLRTPGSGKTGSTQERTICRVFLQKMHAGWGWAWTQRFWASPRGIRAPILQSDHKAGGSPEAPCPEPSLRYVCVLFIVTEPMLCPQEPSEFLQIRNSWQPGHAKIDLKFLKQTD